MKIVPLFCLGLLAACGVGALATPATPVPEGVRAVSKHQAVFAKPPGMVPTDHMPDGPLLGNGDLAVVMAGPPEEMRFFIGKNDFWGRVLPGHTLTDQQLEAGETSFAHTKNAGRLLVAIPALTGATYRLEQSLAEAEVRGTFARSNLTVHSRTRVDANNNLLVSEFSCEGGGAELVLRQMTGPGGGVSAVKDSAYKVNVGREQNGGGRWYFHGEIAGVVISAQALQAEDIRKAAASKPGKGQSFDGQTTWHEMDAPIVNQALALSAWIKLDEQVTDQSVLYIVSKGEWNEAYSLGVTLNRRLRWSVNGQIVESPQPLERGKWIHVAGTFDGHDLSAFVNGEKVGDSLGVCGWDRKDCLLWGYRDADPLPGARRVAWATRVAGAPARTGEDGFLHVALDPGHPVTIMTAVSGDLDAADPVQAARQGVLGMDGPSLARLADGHLRWWTDFWSRSFIEIPDQEIERRWYAALYTVASCNRAGKIPAGLWGWATADLSAWCGAYTMNYNFVAPYFLVHSSNHPELALNYFRVISDFVDKGRDLAKSRGFKGSYFPTGIGPWGWHFGADPGRFPAFADFGQRSNAALAGTLFITHWRMTQDEKFLRETGYPFLRGVAEFWEDYLKLENGRYVINNDSIHEGSGPDMNPLLSLGLVRELFKQIVPMSEILGVDAEKRAIWREIGEKLSAFPAQERGGKTVFRYSEKGTAWWGDNAVGVQHIFPAGAIGLGSDSRLLEISRNTIDAMGRWSDNNGCSTWYSACARVGYDPKVILARLRHECDTRSMPNLVLRYGGGGLENCGIFAAVTEMLLQSHEGVLRFFPVWPKDQDARFGTLRARGAFLVSATLRDGVVSGVRIVSEKGRPCLVQNPWPGRAVKVARNGAPGVPVEAADRYTLATAPGEVLELSPQ